MLDKTCSAHNRRHERCRRCRYGGSAGFWVICDYIGKRAARRPCSAEDGSGNCTAWEPKPKGRPLRHWEVRG